jgi:acyl-CoA synthetase (AMP-forming)/AMP-acid ligase II/acyl carrier protein
MIAAETLVELMRANRSRQRAVVYLEGEQAERRVGIDELHERALGILHHLQSIGAGRGDKLILFLASNEQFIDAFWAAIMGGLIPVPVAIGISDEHRHKLLRIADRLGDPFLYTDRKALDRLAKFAAEHDLDPRFARLQRRTFVSDDLFDVSRAGRTVEPRPDDVAFIQFSSGSTSEPKGVVLTHRNILANTRGATECAGFTEDDVSLSWMPLTHDMGLIGFHIMMYANGVHQHLMPTDLFVRRPLLWMDFAARKGVTITCSPNFGYRHFLKVLGDRPADHWDLSSVRLIFNGAEPISAELCEEFLTRMAPARLDPRAMFPVYGLAEASLAVSFPEPGSRLVAKRFDRHALTVGREAGLTDDASNGLELVCVGRPIPYCEMRLVDDGDQPVRRGTVGHIQIRGDNVTAGYFEAPETNAATVLADGWVRTGDLGLELEEGYYITGRAKDIIFVNGQNYYPHDLETIAQRVPGLELNKVAVAAVRRPASQTDEIAVFVIHRGSIEEFVPTADKVRRLINEQAGLDVGYVVPVKRIPKTTSGKLQRHALEASFIDGEFDAELEALAALEAARASEPATGVTDASVQQQLQAICDATLPDRRIDPDDNLFEIGVSSLKLIEIHEQIDRLFPGQVELTELFDFPTIAELARHLEAKLAAGSG